MIYGYARVSAPGENIEGQVDQLKAAGADYVIQEIAISAHCERIGLARAMYSLRPGDLLIVTRLNKIARSRCDLLDILGAVVERQAHFKSLMDTWADTTTPDGQLMAVILEGLTEFDREMVSAPSNKGWISARLKGVKIGRKFALTRYQQREALRRLREGEGSHAEIAASYNVARSTISRLAARSL